MRGTTLGQGPALAKLDQPWDNTKDFWGLMVQAGADEGIESLAVALGAGLYVDIAGAVSIAVIDSDTLAGIGAGAQVNQGVLGGAGQPVRVDALNLRMSAFWRGTRPGSPMSRALWPLMRPRELGSGRMWCRRPRTPRQRLQPRRGSGPSKRGADGAADWGSDLGHWRRRHCSDCGGGGDGLACVRFLGLGFGDEGNRGSGRQ